MAAASWLMAVGWISILAGLVVCLFGLGMVLALFSGGGAPTGGVGIYILLTLVAGPLLLFGGPGVIFSAVRFMGGYAWARTALEVFWWLMLVSTTSYLAYVGFTKLEILPNNVLQGALYFLFTGVPSIVMLILLRSESIRSAMIR